MATEVLYRHGCEEKICTKCGIKKSRSEFPLHKGKPRARCKPCHTADAVKWAVENGDKRKAYHRGYRDRNREKLRVYKQKLWAEKPEEEKAAFRAHRAAYTMSRHYKSKYGITQDDWDAMYSAQGGVCAICKVPGRTGKHKILSVDHCHTTGRVRGLLCSICNSAIGSLGETPEQWEVVWRYLRGD